MAGFDIYKGNWNPVGPNSPKLKLIGSSLAYQHRFQMVLHVFRSNNLIECERLSQNKNTPILVP